MRQRVLFQRGIHFSLYFDNIDNKRAKQRQKELAGTRPNKKSDLKENLPEGNKGQSRDKISSCYGYEFY